jgi:hypothetical protein
MRVVILDTSWTPDDRERPDIVPLRAMVSAVAERRDLFHESLSRLDSWAERTDLADRLTLDGVSWWYRVRPSIVDFWHERLMWAAVLDLLLGDGRDGELVVPGGEAALARVAAAFGSRGARISVEPAVAQAAPAAGASRRSRTERGWLAGWRTRRRQREIDRRAQVLETRLAALAASERRVLVIAQPRIYQAVRGPAGERLIDPQLLPVVERLAERGMTPIVLGLEVDHGDDRDWAILQADSRLYPQSLMNERWPASAHPPGIADAMSARIDALREIPLEVDGVDLAPILVDELRRYGGSFLVSQTRLARRAEALMRDIRPAAMFLDHEGIRTPWVAAARRAGVPILAVQHGLIYERHAVYSHVRGPGLLVPDITFTFGAFERDVLLRYGGYYQDEVEVSGSPRLDLDGATGDRPSREAERLAVRRSLRVAPDATMLVVSTAHTTVFRRFYLPHMLDRLLGGPLPGVHVVFKQHPGERDDGPYRALLEGMAASRGYAPPPITVVRDIDLYALLRAADAHLGLHSTVLTDAVMAGTPNLISAAQAYGDLLGYVEAGVARPVRTVDEMRDALADPRPTDPAARAAFLEQHFRAGDASARIADTISRVVAGTGGVGGVGDGSAAMAAAPAIVAVRR